MDTTGDQQGPQVQPQYDPRLLRLVVSNTNFINSHRSKLKHFNLNDMKNRQADLEQKVLNLPRQTGDIRASTPQGPTGTITAPILASLEPSDYRAFRDMYKAHARVHKWSDKVAKQKLLLSVSPKIYSTLKSAVTDLN